MTNSSANPVPVSGNVNVANTVPVSGTVNVASLPAVQLNGNISAAITNPTGSPVPTLATEALHSFSSAGQCSFGGLNA